VKQLSPADGWQLFLETANAPNQVAALGIYDPATAPSGGVTFEDVLRHVERRLHLAPPFRRTLLNVPLGLDEPYWIEDSRFDLEYHVRHSALPRPGSWKQLAAQAARLHSQPLDLSRPPWEIYMIEGVDGMQDVPSGSFAALIKLHHAAIDGVAGNQLVSAIHDLSPEPDGTEFDDPWQPDAVPSDWRLLRRAAMHNLLLPVRMGRVVARQVPAVRQVRFAIRRRRRAEPDVKLPGMGVPRTRFGGRVTPHKVIEYRKWPLSSVRAMKAVVDGATVNDVALALCGGSLRRYLLANDELPERTLVTIMPVSTRTEEERDTGGNRISVLRVPLYTDIADPVERLRAIRTITAAAKAVQRGVPAQVLAGISEEVPGRLIGAAQRATAQMATLFGASVGANTTVTNVPGPREPLYLCGARQVVSAGAGPTVDGLGLIHIVSSYCDDFSVSVTACREMLPDPAAYGDCLDDSFTELHEAATSSSAPRRRVARASRVSGAKGSLHG
jgi:diacylglycerol O-acyltransferase / wax synthase